MCQKFDEKRPPKILELVFHFYDGAQEFELSGRQNVLDVHIVGACMIKYKFDFRY